jgi:hypothetical protein
MKDMDKARIRVDFNELVQPNVVLLSQADLVVDSRGTEIPLTEGLPVSICPPARLSASPISCRAAPSRLRRRSPPNLSSANPKSVLAAVR